MEQPTIAAIATGPARGGIGVIRLSGPRARAAAATVARALPAAPAPRHAYFTAFVDQAGQVLDEGLALFFPAPASYTGEDVAELHLHGSPRLLSLVLSRLLTCDGVRLAEPGEFTRRAFLNGRIDLARAEAVAELVAADSELAVRAAGAQLAGALSERLAALRGPLLALHADLEGALDFPDEAEGADAGLAARLDASLVSLRGLTAAASLGALVRRGARVVLFGPVNAGKSTLFNALVGEARALVDAEPGTTRDALEARLELDGLGVVLLDTAGLREEPGRLEALGIARTREALAQADLAVLVLPPEASDGEVAKWRAEVAGARRLDVASKADLVGEPPRPSAQQVAEPGSGVGVRGPGAAVPRAEAPATRGLAVSGQTGQGVEALREAISRRLSGGEAQAVSLVAERHLEALHRGAEALERARLALDVSTLEVVSGEVGLALAALGDITGEDVSGALLDEIFRRFCIGK